MKITKISRTVSFGKKEEKPTKKGYNPSKHFTNCLVIGHSAGSEKCLRDNIDNCVLIGDGLKFPSKNGETVVGDILWGKPVTKEFREFIINNVEHIKRLLRSNYVI